MDVKKLNPSMKVVCVTKLSNTLIVQLKILKYIDGISSFLFPTWVLMRKFHIVEIEWYFLVLFIMRENSFIADIIH